MANRGELVIQMRASVPVTVRWMAGREPGPRREIGEIVQVDSEGGFSEARFDLTDDSQWRGTIRDVAIQFNGFPGTKIEIESIQLE